MREQIIVTDRPQFKIIQQIGGDESVIAAARVSVRGAESLDSWETDTVEAAGLINFLMRNRHGTPFEHNLFTFYVQAGIFVFREFHRHRIGWSYNEESGRYKQLDPLFYVPGPERPLIQVGKPGAYEMVPGPPELHADVVQALAAVYETAYRTYETLLDAGVAREIARLCLPVGINSSMYATCNARSLMAFLSLRTDDEAARIPSKPQYEIEQVARLIESEFARVMPITYNAFVQNGRQAP